MRIGVVQPRISYHDGGGEYYPMDAISFVAKNHPDVIFDVYTLCPPAMPTERYSRFKEQVTRNVNIFEFEIPDEFRYLYEIVPGTVRYRWDIESYYFANLLLKKLNADTRPDLIWTYYLMDFPFNIGIPTVLNLLGYPREKTQHREALLSQYSQIVSISENTVNKWNDVLDIPIKKYKVMHQGVTFSDAESNIPEGFEQGRTNVLFVGRLIERKGILLLCEVVKKISKTKLGNKIRLHICGEGELQNNIKQFVINDNLEDYIFIHGQVLNVNDYYKNADFCVFPSHRGEGLMSTVIEAMYSNGTVVTTSENGNEELIVDGKSGFLIPPNDFDSLYSVINELVLDTGKRDSVKECAKASAKTCTWEQYAEHFLTICSSLNG